MRLGASTAAELQRHQIEYSQDFPLARRTWWRVGGPADVFAKVGSVEQLCAIQRMAHELGESVFVLGNGSNLLVSDAGIRGFVIQLNGALAQVTTEGDKSHPVLEVGGGMRLLRLVKKAVERGWSGIEVFGGIPGTMGGAVRMNAGASLGETSDLLLDINLVNRFGEAECHDVETLNMSYRTCHLPTGAIVSSARLQTTSADPAAVFAKMNEFLVRRKATQPTDHSSCGSTFRNPPNDYAGRLIESVGLKGFRIGAAEVSQKHANFVVNHKGTSADDLRSVIEHTQHTVLKQTGVALHREVHFVGDWSHWPMEGAE